MRVALCLSGMVRTFTEVYPSLQQYILGPWKPDVFVHTYDMIGLRKSPDQPVSESWLNGMLQPVSCRIRSLDEFENIHTRERDRLYCYPGPVWAGGVIPESVFKLKNVLSMLWHVHECDLLRREHEERSGFQYDVVIRARMDSLFRATPDPLKEPGLQSFPSKMVCVPNHSGFGGLCDQFAMGDGDSMRIYSDYHLNFESVFRSRALVPPGWGVPETLLKRYFHRFTDLKAQPFHCPFDIQREGQVDIQTHFDDEWWQTVYLREMAA